MDKKDKSSEWIKSLKTNLENPEGLNFEENTEQEHHLITKPNHYGVYLTSIKETPVEFVEFIISNFFKTHGKANINFQNEIDLNSEIFCGTFTRELAESKVVEVIECSRSNNFNLKCIMRRDQEYAGKKS